MTGEQAQDFGDADLEALREAEEALIAARQALTRIVAGIGGRADRETFAFQVGFARGRLSRVSERIYQAGETS